LTWFDLRSDLNESIGRQAEREVTFIKRMYEGRDMEKAQQEDGGVERADAEIDEVEPVPAAPQDGGLEGWLIALGSFLIFLNTWV